MHAYVLTSLATLLVVLVMFSASGLTGKARSRYKIAAPATTGHEGFERAFRAQMNTMEWALMFLPALWVFAYNVSDLYAGGLAMIACAGRLWYIVSYIQDPRKREAGFVIGHVALAVAALWSLCALILQLLG